MARYTQIGVEAVVKGTQKFTNQLAALNGGVAGVAMGITTAAINAGVAITRAFAGIVDTAFDTAVEFESTFAGVRKTVEGTEEDFANLALSFRDLSKTIPVDTSTINQIAELGGQLGVVDKDTEDITATMTAFVETIAALGESTNLSTEAAATDLARFANIMGTTAREGDESYSKLGSAIVDLGNNFATTERDILNFATRIAASGNIAGMTEGDVFAIGAAMSSVGVQAEAGGTAVQKTLLLMNDAIRKGGEEFEIFAGAAGMSAEDFSKMWEEDAGGAFTEFVAGLGEMGDDAGDVLEALGLKDQRLIKAFLSLAPASDILREAMESSNSAFEEDTALQEEAAKRYATTESQMKIMKNTIDDVLGTLGAAVLPIVNDMLSAVQPLVNELGVWLEENLPTAIEFLTNVWNEKLVPAFEEAKTFVLGTLLPAFNDLVEFFKTEGPGALETLRGIWETVWGVIQEKASVFISWFEENLPLIQETGETIANFWKNNIAPTLDNVWGIIEGLFDMFSGNILESAELVMNLINGNWEEAWENVKEVASNIWDNIKKIASEFLEGVLNFFGSNTEEFTNQWKENWELAKTIVSEIWEKIKTFFVTTWENIKTSAITAWENLKTTISTAIENIKTSITEKLNSIKEFWTGIWEGIKGIVGEKIQGAKDKVNEILTSLFEKMGLDLDSMKERWSTIFSDLQAIAAEIWDRIKSAIVTRLTTMSENLAKIWDAISTKASEIWETISTKLGEVWDAISTKATEIWNAVSTKVSEVWDTISTYVGEKIDALATKLGEVWNAISTKVTEVWDAVVAVVTEKALAIYTAVTGKIEEIKTWFGEQVESFKTFGGDLIQGFIDGVASKAGKLIESVTGAVEGAISAAKRLLGIESPSKLFMEIGANTMLGFQQGIAEMAPQNQAVMQAAVSPMVAAPEVMPNSSVTINMGGNTINSQLDIATFEARVLSVVTGAIS